MAPTNLNHTCRAAEGHAGSLIDYFMVSLSVRPLIGTCEVVLDTPWGPHYGVMLKISTDVNKVLVWDVTQPHRTKDSFARKAEQAQLDEEEANRATARRPAGMRVEDEVHGDPAVWNAVAATSSSEAAESTCTARQSQARGACTEFSEHAGIAKVANQIGQAFEAWGRTSNAYFQAMADYLDEAGPASLSPHVVPRAYRQVPKGAFPDFHKKPVLPKNRPPLHCIVMPGGGNMETRLWMSAAVWLKVLGQTTDLATQHHACYAAQRLSFFCQATDSAALHTIGQLVEEDLQAFLHTVLKIFCGLQNGTRPDVQPALTLAMRFAEQAAVQGRDKCKSRLHEWLTIALKRGAGQAHKWSNAPNALPAL